MIVSVNWSRLLSAGLCGGYFDDFPSELLGIADSRWQSLYHFTLSRTPFATALGA
jgi:hypothetical protein